MCRVSDGDDGEDEDEDGSDDDDDAPTMAQFLKLL